MKSTGNIQENLDEDFCKRELLRMVRNAHPFVLAGNHEYYDCIDYSDETGFVIYGGDTVANKEEYREPISEEKVLEKVKIYWIDHAKYHSQHKDLKTIQEIYEYAYWWRAW